MLLHRKVIIFLIVFGIFSFSAYSQSPTGSITGRIINKSTKAPISSITVRVLNTQLGAISSVDGRFTIQNVPAGVYAVKFSGVGFEPFSQTDVVVSSGRPVSLEVELVDKIIQLEETEVRASFFVKKVETATSTQTLNAEDIRRAPGVQEDVIRATALLPGVGVTGAGRNDLLVRGGAPFENLFTVDNLEVNNINHFGSQGSTGGPLSIINIDFVRSVDFSAGGFGAVYGDKLSSSTNIKLRNGNEEKFAGKLNLSATGFGVNVEGPVSDKGSYFFSARRSYLDFLFNAAGFGFIPQYWDFQGKMNYRLDQKNTLSFLMVTAIGNVKLNNDNLDNILDNSQIAVPQQYQNFWGLTWQRLFGSGFTTVTLGSNWTKFETFQNDSNLVEIFRNNSREAELILRTDVDWQISRNFELKAGNQVKWGGVLEYDVLLPGNLRIDKSNSGPYDESFHRPLAVDTTFREFKNATYASLTFPIGNHRLTFGGRMEYFSMTPQNLYFSPRASFIYFINPMSSIIASAGRYYQSPMYIWLIGDAMNENLEAMQSDQLVLGYEHTPLQDVKVQLEVYHKWYNNYPARVWRPQAVLAPSGFDDISNDIPYGLEPLASEGKGTSYGAELFIQKKLTPQIPIYGLLSLSWSKTEFTSIDGIKRAGSFDSRWIFNVAMGWRINPKWEISSKFRLATGVPTTPYVPAGEINAGELDFSQFNAGERLPLFHALDFRIDRRWNFTNFTLVTYIDVQNAYGRENASGYRWDLRTQRGELQSSLGLLPSIGVSFEF